MNAKLRRQCRRRKRRLLRRIDETVRDIRVNPREGLVEDLGVDPPLPVGGTLFLAYLMYPFPR